MYQIVRDIDGGFADVRTGNRHDGLAVADELSDFGRPGGHDAVEIGVKLGIADLLLGQEQRRIGLIESGFGGVAAGDGFIQRCLRGCAARGESNLPRGDALGVG